MVKKCFADDGTTDSDGARSTVSSDDDGLLSDGDERWLRTSGSPWPATEDLDPPEPEFQGTDWNDPSATENLDPVE